MSIENMIRLIDPVSGIERDYRYVPMIIDSRHPSGTPYHVRLCIPGQDYDVPLGQVDVMVALVPESVMHDL